MSEKARKTSEEMIESYERKILKALERQERNAFRRKTLKRNAVQIRAIPMHSMRH
jgi:hypothetical protein